MQSQVGGLSEVANGLPSQQIATVQPSQASPGSSGGLMSLLRVNVATSFFHACRRGARVRSEDVEARRKFTLLNSVSKHCFQACVQQQFSLGPPGLLQLGQAGHLSDQCCCHWGTWPPMGSEVFPAHASVLSPSVRFSMHECRHLYVIRAAGSRWREVMHLPLKDRCGR